MSFYNKMTQCASLTFVSCVFKLVNRSTKIGFVSHDIFEITCKTDRLFPLLLKLREGIVFTGVCLSVPGVGGGKLHHILIHHR